MTSVPSPSLFNEHDVRRALVRICNAAGATAGTGFFIGSHEVLTCHHVVANLPAGAISLELSDGQQALGEFQEQRSAVGSDVAILRVQLPAPVVLPCGERADAGLSVWTIGFHSPSSVAAGAVPTNATIGGSVKVEFVGPKKYTIESGFTLEGATIRPGLSGAPVIDRETGAVLGIVDAQEIKLAQIVKNQVLLKGGQIDGFAIDLDRTAARNPGLADLLHANREQVAAFGRHLNACGVRALCREQVCSAIRELENTGQYSRTTYTSRQIEQQVSSFLQSGKKLMPVVGHTGVGKTTLLGYLAQQLIADGQPAALVRGFHVSLHNSAGLIGDLQSEFARVGGAKCPDLAALQAALSRGARLVVLVDALNEIVFTDVQAVLSWWSRTVDLLAASDVRVVVTSRVQFWEGLADQVQPGLCFSPEEPPQRDGAARGGRANTGVALGDFTSDEYEQARVSYGLGGQEFVPGLGQHPFFLRIWAELAGEQLDPEPGARPTTHELLTRYVEVICRKVSRVTNQQFSKQQVARVVRGLGADALNAKANAIPHEAVEARLAGSAPLQNALIREHVVEEGRDGFRFAFDSVAEYLMSEHVQPAALSDEQLSTLLRYGFDSLAGAIGLAVLREEHAGQLETVERILDRIVQWPTRGGWRVSCVSRLLADFLAPAKYFPHLLGLVQGAVISDWDLPWGIEGIGRLARSGRLPAGTVIDLLKPALTCDHSFRYEWHHWLEWTTREFEADDASIHYETLSTVILKAFDAWPESVMETLVVWLDDTTRLWGNKATIGDAAAAFLYHRRGLVFDRLCDAIVQKGKEWDRLLCELTVAEPRRFVGLLDRWSLDVEGKLDPWVVATAWNLVRKGKGVPDEPGLVVSLDRLWDRGADHWTGRPEIYATLIATLSMLPSRRDRVFPKIADSLHLGWQHFPVDLLGPYTDDRLPAVLEVLDRCLATGIPRLVRDTASFLGSFSATPAQTAAALERLDRLVAAPPTVTGSMFGLAVERLLRGVSAESPERGRLLALARRCVRESSPEDRRALIYYAAPVSSVGDTTDKSGAEELLNDLLAGERDSHNQILLVQRVCASQQSFPALLNKLGLLFERKDRDRFEDTVVDKLYLHGRYRIPEVYFVDWVKTTDPTTLGKRFRSLHTLASSGASPDEVLADAYSELKRERESEASDT
jgi:hypothetical protein